ncbi:hypothetical protein BZA05DRAFT_416221 [Tricharina praecox]|uniref:uncharacterized protein n=1 Tax=Tricharina praecox TaxID=43433 RepID=UPI00221EB11A|nr:uncharacterized protein BZA05DRAFT_416221 [Tricharina praecox]KAI5856567.1 hypothetical protein BZA05DRAFT_416221 [Tricharina praecox]
MAPQPTIKLSLYYRKPPPHPVGIPIFPDRFQAQVFKPILDIFGVTNYDQIRFDFRFEVLRMFRQQPELMEVEPLLTKMDDYFGNVGLDERHKRHAKGYLLYLLI